MEVCKKCGGSKFVDALRKYNEGKPAWCIPRKGTELHAEVLKIMNANKPPTRKLRKAPSQSSEYSQEMMSSRNPKEETKKQVIMNSTYIKENTGRTSRKFIYQVISPTEVALIGYDTGNYSRAGKVKKYGTIKKYKWELANDYNSRFLAINDDMPNQSAERHEDERYNEIKI